MIRPLTSFASTCVNVLVQNTSSAAHCSKLIRQSDSGETACSSCLSMGASVHTKFDRSSAFLQMICRQ
jgi:hypothetical protein